VSSSALSAISSAMANWSSMPNELKKEVVKCLPYLSLLPACLGLGQELVADCQKEIFTSVYINSPKTLELLARSYNENGSFQRYLLFLHVDCARFLDREDGGDLLRVIPDVVGGCSDIVCFTVSSFHLVLETPEDVRHWAESGFWRMMKRVGKHMRPSCMVIERCVFHPVQFYYLLAALPIHMHSLIIRDVRDQPILRNLVPITQNVLSVETLVVDHTMASFFPMLALQTQRGSLAAVHLSRCMPRSTETSFSYLVTCLWEGGNGPRTITWRLPIEELGWAVEDLTQQVQSLAVNLERLTLILEGDGMVEWVLTWGPKDRYWEFLQEGTMTRIAIGFLPETGVREGLVRMLDVANNLSSGMDLEGAVYSNFPSTYMTAM